MKGLRFKIEHWTLKNQQPPAPTPPSPQLSCMHNFCLWDGRKGC